MPLTAGTTSERAESSNCERRNDVIPGVGGNQALVEDSSGNPIELFQPVRPEARLTPTT
jgi:hypothetical protein